jgi:hypothetical protein
MLGDQIGEDKGKITGQRVLEVVNGIPKIETSMSTIGKYKGVETTEIATYWATPGPDGVMHGEGQGVVTTRDGSEMATWTGQGIGRFISQGKLRFIGSLFFSTSSSGKLTFFKSLVAVFEFEADEQGNTSSKVWEWK